MKLCAEKPCPTCPWRKSSTVGGADIEGFSMDKMRKLANTVPPRGSREDGFYTVMACHHAKEGQEYACAGYALREGMKNINFRMMMRSEHGIDMRTLLANAQGIELYDSFYDMLDDYEAAQ